MSENTAAVESRIDTLDKLATHEARATVLRHALGMDDPLGSLTNEYLARVVTHLDDDETRTPSELTTMFKKAKLKADAAEVLGVDEIKTSVGPFISRTIAMLESEYDAPIADIAKMNKTDDERFENFEATITGAPFDTR